MFLSRKESEAPTIEPRTEPTKSTVAIAEPPRPVAAAPAKPATAPSSATVPVSDTKRLIVGQGITLAGEITACDRLVVEGAVRVTLNKTRAIEISETGRFTEGKAAVEEADISGVYEGELTVRKRLLIRSTGRVSGTVRYGDIEIERGGRLSGAVARLETGS
ncbi:MAG TPA: polymer-forming cytoskeletal protein [Geminicoccaceae bacterium]|nr:polymer-forming cytoskeletal protein [Geminicoccus sp.]HMU50000.1 polymer-forming cytoskeletal protein [Geminicoccaceae bacterium]